MSEKTVKLDPQEMSDKLAVTVTHDNVDVTISLSDYDIPRSVSVSKDEETGKIKITFKYKDEEEAEEKRADERLSFYVGENSGKLMGFLINYGSEAPDRIVINITQIIDNELTNARKETQRLNFGLIRDVVSSKLEPLLA